MDFKTGCRATFSGNCGEGVEVGVSLGPASPGPGFNSRLVCQNPIENCLAAIAPKNFGSLLACLLA